MFQCSYFPWLFSRLLLWLALSTVFSSQSAAGFILPFNFGGSGQIDARFTANPLLCSFSDEATGFYASWHSNCSGLVNFVLNVRNFPRPELPPGIGLYRDTVFGHFWTGIGFHLISTEMALVESPAPMLVSVTPARIELGRPPVRELGVGGGILINPRGSFIGSTLEATFSVDESLLTGCKELLFYSAPTPVGAPYGGVPYSKAVCDLARTCTRFPTCGDFVTPMLGAGIAPMDLLDGQMPIGGYPQQMGLYQPQMMLDPYMAQYGQYGQPGGPFDPQMMEQPFGLMNQWPTGYGQLTSQQQFGSPYDQQGQFDMLSQYNQLMSQYNLLCSPSGYGYQTWPQQQSWAFSPSYANNPYSVMSSGALTTPLSEQKTNKRRMRRNEAISVSVPMAK